MQFNDNRAEVALLPNSILITGWNGFLGSYICTAFEEAKISMIRCGRARGSDLLCDLETASPIIPNHVDYIVHSAGLAHVNQKVSKRHRHSKPTKWAESKVCKVVRSG